MKNKKKKINQEIEALEENDYSNLEEILEKIFRGMENYQCDAVIFYNPDSREFDYGWADGGYAYQPGQSEVGDECIMDVCTVKHQEFTPIYFTGDFDVDEYDFIPDVIKHEIQAEINTGDREVYQVLEDFPKIKDRINAEELEFHISGLIDSWREDTSSMINNNKFFEDCLREWLEEEWF